MKANLRCFLVFCILSCWVTGSFAATGEAILSSEDAQAADAEALLAELAVFRSIRAGITLSVAQCDPDSGTCEPAASSVEVQQLISALDQRIEALTRRQQESPDTVGLEEVLVAYVDEREGFSAFLEKLGTAPESDSVVGEYIDESELFGDDSDEGEEAAETTEKPADLDIFADEDEEL